MNNELTGERLDNDFASAATMRTVRERRASLTCMLCGRVVGHLLRSDDGPIRFMPVDGNPPEMKSSWRLMRCNHCNGNLFPDEVEEHLVRVESGFSMLDYGENRRGRPPRWLSEQRRLDQAIVDRATESQKIAS